MIPLIRLKKDVTFNHDLTVVVDALKGIALARYYTLEKQLVRFERLTSVVKDFLELIDPRDVDHPFMQIKKQNASVIMITSDGGFLGGLNSQVINRGLREADSDGLLTIVGERGANGLRDLRKKFTGFPGIVESRQSELAAKISDHAMRQILRGESGRLVIVYPNPISLTTQHVEAEVLLPCEALLAKTERHSNAHEFIWESSPRDLLSYVVSQWVGHRLNQIFSLSRLAELGARSMHLEGSYQEVIRIGKKLKHQYFRARHEVIDRSMREVFAAQLLFGQKADEEAVEAGFQAE